jgi:hypothetical protein
MSPHLHVVEQARLQCYKQKKDHLYVIHFAITHVILRNVDENLISSTLLIGNESMTLAPTKVLDHTSLNRVILSTFVTKIKS